MVLPFDTPDQTVLTEKTLPYPSGRRSTVRDTVPLKAYPPHVSTVSNKVSLTYRRGDPPVKSWSRLRHVDPGRCRDGGSDHVTYQLTRGVGGTGSVLVRPTPYCSNVSSLPDFTTSSRQPFTFNDGESRRP